MIHGKIKKNLLNKFKSETFIEISENMNIISIEKLIGLLNEEAQGYDKLKDALRLIEYIHEYNNVLSKNITLSSQLNEIINNLNLILRFYTLSKRKNLLLKELKLSEFYNESRNKTALSDLLKKLIDSLKNNKAKLKFLEEDYLQRKNQVDQVKNKVEELNIKIQKLTNKKKQCFNQINRITRSMSENTPEIKEESKFTGKNTKNNLTNAQKIKNFQLKAKDIQYKINESKSKKTENELKLKDLNPIFESYKSDYENTLEIINNEENRINEIQIELKKEISDSKDTFIEDLELVDLKSLKPSQVIKDEIEKIDRELAQIFIPKKDSNSQNASAISNIIQNLKELEEYINKHKSELTITVNENETIKCIDQFTNLENIISEIEFLINKFLSEVNLIAQFRLALNDNNNKFFINTKFIRRDNKQVNFDGLTTPEKVFFIIVFYISIKLHTKSKNIIISNVSILTKYNKAGSIYRTIRKILPLFEKDDILLGFNLVFILSNLELKKEIKNLKIKTIQEI